MPRSSSVSDSDKTLSTAVTKTMASAWGKNFLVNSVCRVNIALVPGVSTIDNDRKESTGRPKQIVSSVSLSTVGFSAYDNFVTLAVVGVIPVSK